MREIVQIQLGQCGNQIGNNFWEDISKEHGIGYDGYFIYDNNEIDHRYESKIRNQLQRINIYYNESICGKYIPRSIGVDFDPSIIDDIKSSSMGKLFKPDNLFTTTEGGAGKNFARAFYSYGEEIIDSIMDIIRKEVEQTDSLQGFQLTHSLNGGTGSGLTSLLLSKLREEYPDRLLCTFTVFPSTNSDSSLASDPYNSTLALHHFMKYTDQVICIDNEALHNICQRSLKIPTFKELNGIISNVMSGITSSLRFPSDSQLNSDLRKLSVNLIPFPNLRFLTPSFAPFITCDETILDLTQQVFNINNMMIKHSNSTTDDNGIGSGNSKYLAASITYRGNNISAVQIDEQISSFSNSNSNKFIEWVPDNIKSTICSVPIKQYDQSVTLLCNNLSIQDTFSLQLSRFDNMFRRKAFTSWYYGEGMDEHEMVEAQSNLIELINEYQKISSCCNN